MNNIYEFIPADLNLPPLDDAPDPKLKPISSFKSISEILELIKFLASVQPSGHLLYLLQLSVHEYEEVALSALQTLHKLGNPKIVPYILALLANQNFSSQRRFVMLKIVMEIPAPLDSNFIEQILYAEKDVIIKSGLVKVFARNAMQNGLETLKKCITDSDPRVRANTIEIIDELQISGCEEEIKLLLKDTENRVKVNAAKYLIRRGYSEAFQILRNMLTSQEVWLRDSVIYALGEIGDQSALTLLKAASKDPNQGIRLSVIKALAKIKSSAAIETLQTLTNDPDPVVAQVAKTYIEKIQSQTDSSKSTTKTSILYSNSNTIQTKSSTNQTLNKSFPSKNSINIQEKIDLDLSEQAINIINNISISELPSINASSQASKGEIEDENHVRMKLPSLPKNLSDNALIQPNQTKIIDTQQSHSVSTQSLNLSQNQSISQRIISSTTSPSSNFIPKFQKTRSAEIYSKLVSNNADQIESALKDIPFVMGEDQIILLEVAASLNYDNARLTAAKLLSRKKGAKPLEIIQKLANDPNPIVSSLAQKALTIMK